MKAMGEDGGQEKERVEEVKVGEDGTERKRRGKWKALVKCEDAGEGIEMERNGGRKWL